MKDKRTSLFHQRIIILNKNLYYNRNKRYTKQWSCTSLAGSRLVQSRSFTLNSRQVLNKHEPVYQALWAGPCDFDEVLISPVMIQDHMPDNMLRALNKVSRDASVVRQQIRRSQASLSRTPSVKPGHYEPLEETVDGPDIPNEMIQRDRITRTTDQAVNGVDRARVRPGVDCTSIVVDVEVHERKETLPESRWQSEIYPPWVAHAKRSRKSRSQF